MFFVKVKNSNKAYPVTTDNVFTICPRCQCEVEVDLKEFLAVGTLKDGVFCKDCAKFFVEYSV